MEVSCIAHVAGQGCVRQRVHGRASCARSARRPSGAGELRSYEAACSISPNAAINICAFR